MVLKVGIEPTRPKGLRILSPARLPVPPLQQVFQTRFILSYEGFAYKCFLYAVESFFKNDTVAENSQLKLCKLTLPKIESLI
jgi:hypothetical protein